MKNTSQGGWVLARVASGRTATEWDSTKRVPPALMGVSPAMMAMTMTMAASLTMMLATGCGTAEVMRPEWQTPPAETMEKSREAKSNALPPLASRLSDRWLARTTMLTPLKGVIYYRGSERRVSATTEPWTGTVTGDILYVTPWQAIMIPVGTLTLAPDDAMKIVGTHRAMLAKKGEKAVWLELLGD